MFSILISANPAAWELAQRMSMMKDRFLEHSGDEATKLSLQHPDSLRALERVHTLLLYEDCVDEPHATIARVGHIRDIRIDGAFLSFRFVEQGQLPRQLIVDSKYRLQLDDWEFTRSHWAVKDGDFPSELLTQITPTQQRYDVVLSYAGEDRGYVESVARILESRGVIAFYDRNEQASMWGKDLATHLDEIFRIRGRYCIMFISRHYATKMWPSHERSSAMARAIEQQVEYVLPARFDDSSIPGLKPTIGYVDLRSLPPDQLADLILQKLGRSA